MCKNMLESVILTFFYLNFYSRTVDIIFHLLNTPMIYRIFICPWKRCIKTHLKLTNCLKRFSEKIYESNIERKR